MEGCLYNAKAKIENNNYNIDENARKLAEATLGKDNVKINKGDADAIINPYMENNKFHLVDPLETEKLIEKLQSEVDKFEMEVDATLSEVNALTIIEI